MFYCNVSKLARVFRLIYPYKESTPPEQPSVVFDSLSATWFYVVLSNKLSVYKTEEEIKQGILPIHMFN